MGTRTEGSFYEKGTLEVRGDFRGGRGGILMGHK